MKITIIGGGNIGSAIASGMYSSGMFRPSDITCTDLMQENLDRLKARCPEINVSQDNREAVKNADAVLIALKPWIAEGVIKSIKDLLDPNRQIFMSVVAGATLDMLDNYLGNIDIPVFRLVPNIAIEVKSSMTFITSRRADSALSQKILEIFDALGHAVMVKEELISAGTSMASCGIAFAMRFIRAASEGGVQLGFYPEQAKEIAMMTAKGAVDLIKAHGSNPESEIDKVTTPGGITIKGLNAMEKAGFTNAVIQGLLASDLK